MPTNHAPPGRPTATAGPASWRLALGLAPLAVVVVTAAIVAAAVRTPPAIHKPLWADEVGSARAYTQPRPGAVLSRVRSTESTPPGWYLAAWAVQQAGAAVAGDGPLRSSKLPRTLSVLAGAATTALVVLYTRRRTPLWAAALAGCLAALSYELVEHGAEARAYELVALVVVVFAMALERAAAETSRARLAALVAVTAVGAYVHYFFLLSAAAGLLWVRTCAPEPVRKRLAVAIAGGVATLIPWLPSFVHQVRTQHHSYINAFSVTRLLNVYADMFARAGSWRYTGTAGRLAVVALVLVGAAVLARRDDGRLCALLAVLPLGLSGAMWAAGARIVDTRNLIVVAPFAAVAIAAAVAAIPWRIVAWSAGACIAAGMGGAFWLQTSEGRTASDELAAGLVRLGWTPADALAVFAPYPEALSVAWGLPGHPELEIVKPAPGGCASLFAVVESRRGQRWLREHGDAMLNHVAVPFYGFGPDGKRHAVDAQAVRMRWSYPLARSMAVPRVTLVHAGPGPPRCARRR